jgi:hypothetical protein
VHVCACMHACMCGCMHVCVCVCVCVQGVTWEGEVARMMHLTGKKQWDILHGAGLGCSTESLPTGTSRKMAHRGADGC